MVNTMTKEQISDIFEENAKKVAKEVCGQGNCTACYSCGHENKGSYIIPQMGQNTKCPMAKYNIMPDTRSFREKLEAGEKFEPITEEELFAACACCEFSGGVINRKDEFVLNRNETSYENYCIDCPVNQMKELVAEGRAEAGW